MEKRPFRVYTYTHDHAGAPQRLLQYECFTLPQAEGVAEELWQANSAYDAVTVVAVASGAVQLRLGTIAGQETPFAPPRRKRLSALAVT